MRHGIGVKGGRRGSLAIDKSWEAINKVSCEAIVGKERHQIQDTHAVSSSTLKWWRQNKSFSLAGREGAFAYTHYPRPLSTP